MDQASRELARLVDQDPDNAVARTNLGVVLIQQGKVAQARVQLEAALRSDPTLDAARQALDWIGH
jgi:Flp pilus assembly protein TadD